MKILMLPSLDHFRSETNGIAQVVKAYHKYLPEFGAELVGKDQEYDLIAAHAGHGSNGVEVCHLHGLYFSADYNATAAEYETNREIIEGVRIAKEVTVPSKWVAEVFQRDMRFTPHVIGHGIEWDRWQHNLKHQGYVLWNKNRVGDACNPEAVNRLARLFPDARFVSTFGAKSPNVAITGVLPHQSMATYVKQATVYLSTTKETFGIGTLEAMAAGVPVLGWRFGGNVDLIEHGVNGYLAEPGNYEDLAEGLAYCLKYRDVLGGNGREIARGYTWHKVCEQLLQVYNLAMVEEPPTVSVIIPVYNKTFEEVKRAVDSALNQTFKPEYIIVNDDGSREDLAKEYKELNSLTSVWAVRQENQGVAIARNNGIALTTSKYVCCLDSDDWIDPTFLEVCVKELERDRSLGIAYTGLYYHKPDGESGPSPWPWEWNFDKQLAKQNQVPTCCVFRRKMFDRLGGYRQRYAPQGAGTEDAEFWTRAGAYGWKAKKVTEECLFHYSWLSGQVTGNPNYREVAYLDWHPWVADKKHPFASYATPKRQSHDVRQYDEPIASVVVPVGPGHEREVINALDSLEAQTFRKWEAIVVDDTGAKNSLRQVEISYPYVRGLNTTGSLGAGASRNIGVSIARAPFLLFLDADDTLAPTCLEEMLAGWNRHQTGIYSDYVAIAKIYDEQFLQEIKSQGRLQSYNTRTNEAVWSFHAPEFNCEKALAQPTNPPYQFNLVETLIPTAWHFEIGGFDEKMPTWEDWDYWLRLVRVGHCFTRIPQELVGYRFHTGTRRELAVPETDQGRQNAEIMLQYIRSKYGDEKLMCGCKGKNNGGGNGGQAQAASMEAMSQLMTDENFVKAVYRGSRGKHQVIGAARFEQQFPSFKMRRVGVNPPQYVIDYGYIADGHKTLVHKDDLKLMPCWNAANEVAVPVLPKQELAEPVLLNPVQQVQAVAERIITRARDDSGLNKPITVFDSDLARAEQEQSRFERERMGNPPLVAKGLPSSEDVATINQITNNLFFGPTEDQINKVQDLFSSSGDDFSLQSIPGMNKAVAERLEAIGLNTPEKILKAGIEGLTQVPGIAEARAKAIIKHLSK